MKHPKFIIRNTAENTYCFVLTDKNGQTLLSSEMYNSKDACEAGIELVKEIVPIAEVVDD